MNADLVIVGAGLFGLTIAQQAAERAGARVEIIDVRSHIGGNVYSYIDEETGAEIHQYGAQGGKGKDLVHFFNEDGLGAIVNSSRGIIAAYKQEAYAKYGAENFGDASRAAVEAMVADIKGALENR